MIFVSTKIVAGVRTAEVIHARKNGIRKKEKKIVSITKLKGLYEH